MTIYRNIPVRRLRREADGRITASYSNAYRRVMRVAGQALASGASVTMEHRIVKTGKVYDVMDLSIDYCAVQDVAESRA